MTIFKKLSLFSNRWQALSGNKLNRFGITLNKPNKAVSFEVTFKWIYDFFDI